MIRIGFACWPRICCRPAELTGLEEHLEWCAECREALDHMVGSDDCLTAARRYLRADPTGPHDEPSEGR